MTREEEIIESARNRAERHQIAEMELYGGDKCNYSYGRIYNSEIASFEAGAKWADEHPKSIWHDSSEEPQGEDWLILFEGEKGNYWVQSKDGVIFFHNTWKEYAATEMVAKWAYIDELIKK